MNREEEEERQPETGNARSKEQSDSRQPMLQEATAQA